MQRRKGFAWVATAAALSALSAGCSGGSPAQGKSDAKAGGAASSPAPAPPGKYRVLPSPCKAVDGKRLKAMLPAPATLTADQRDVLYAGTADTSYDGDRRVGCRWNAQAPEETRLLFVGFERVVSYDRAAASDDDKAQGVYERQLADAHLPTPPPTPAPSTPPPNGSAPAPAQPPAAGQPQQGQQPQGQPPQQGQPQGQQPQPGQQPGQQGQPTPGASPSASVPPPELGSRVLDGLGDAAFLDDKLSAAGAMAQARTVRIVFRTANVIVTVEYSVQPTVPGTVPPSAETQDRARQLARELADRFSD
ncbi:DUF3558 domain-containing protein [Streptomyces bambusae]|uniref:DUF3558 domain-containing protein n=1 Tax=Streptomyces bambusae TaxID=1550616 RepID=A0ABS6Z2E6_9ACTN|nr:DUF3558 domain-containing protein [Streptomyces bambusae]MBW5481920.1 DUF3558 domain-containing protein [Streptomyces bambusae]